MTENQALQILKMPTKREVLAKAILVLVGIGMALVIALLWLYGLNMKLQVSESLKQAATVKPVTFTQEDAQALLNRKNAALHPATSSTLAGGSQANGGARQGGDMASRPGGTPPEGYPEGMRGGRGRRFGGGGMGGNNGGPTGGAPAGPSALSPEMVTLVESRPLFGAQPKNGPPQANLQGILGEQALINGNWIKVGEEQGGIKLIKTMADKVVVEIEGQQRDVSAWQELPSSPTPSSGGSSGSPSPGMRGGRGGLGTGLTPAERAQLRREQLANGGSANQALRGSGATRRGLTAVDLSPTNMDPNAPRGGRGGRRGGAGLNTTVQAPAFIVPTPQPNPIQPATTGRGGRRMMQGGTGAPGASGMIDTSGAGGGGINPARTPRATTGGGTRGGRRGGAGAGGAGGAALN